MATERAERNRDATQQHRFARLETRRELGKRTTPERAGPIRVGRAERLMGAVSIGELGA